MKLKKHINKPLLIGLFVFIFALLWFINPACAFAYCIGLKMMYDTRSAFKEDKRYDRNRETA